METVSLQQRVWQVVSEVPEGKIASYGQIATLAGAPRAARQVGQILSRLPSDSRLPWHRILNAKGQISFPDDSEAYRRQKQLLESEGVVFMNRRVSLQQYQWQP